MPGALNGIRVIEFGIAIQGPQAATYLADMGAEVIKIEPPTGGGARYNLGPADLPEGVGSPMFVAANRGKRFMQLDAHVHPECADCVDGVTVAPAAALATPLLAGEV